MSLSIRQPLTRVLPRPLLDAALVALIAITGLSIVVMPIAIATNPARAFMALGLIVACRILAVAVAACRPATKGRSLAMHVAIVLQPAGVATWGEDDEAPGARAAIMGTVLSTTIAAVLFTWHTPMSGTVALVVVTTNAYWMLGAAPSDGTVRGAARQWGGWLLPVLTTTVFAPAAVVMLGLLPHVLDTTEFIVAVICCGLALEFVVVLVAIEETWQAGRAGDRHRAGRYLRTHALYVLALLALVAALWVGLHPRETY